MRQDPKLGVVPTWGAPEGEQEIPTILERAETAGRTLEEYARLKGYTIPDEGLDSALVDFIADMMHLIRLEGMDFDALRDVAQRNFEAEVREETRPGTKGWEPR